ncbi:hypothetical protein Tco_0660512 [Tanacetum coccineum]
MVEPKPVKPTKKKFQIMLDEEIALKLQVEIDEEERIARAEEEKIDEANIAWDDIQEKVDADYKLAKRLKHFAAKRAEKKTQQKKTMITYLKNMEGWKHKDLKSKDFDSIKELFDKAFKRVNMFVDFRTNLVEGSSKRAGEDLEQKSTKKQKVDDDKEINDLKNMFEPHVEDIVWRNQQGYKVLEWKLYDSCGVHFLRMQSMQIYMLVEKNYPLTPPTLTQMLEKKRQIDSESEMAYQLFTAALIDVNATQSKLVLLENFNENYSKCLRLLVKLLLLEEVTTARGSYYC